MIDPMSMPMFGCLRPAFDKCIYSAMSRALLFPNGTPAY